MMALPFFTLFAGLLAGWWRKPRLALVLWALSLLLLLGLFNAHVSDSLALNF